FARNERSASAVGNRHSVDAENAFRGDRAEQPISAAVANARGKGGGTNRDIADDALIRACRRCQTWDKPGADSNSNNALRPDRARGVNTVACTRDQAQNAAITDAGRKAFGTNPLGCRQPGCAICRAWR